jgi:hypothetical protein
LAADVDEHVDLRAHLSRLVDVVQRIDHLQHARVPETRQFWD